jgi:hypothetical protein
MSKARARNFSIGSLFVLAHAGPEAVVSKAMASATRRAVLMAGFVFILGLLVDPKRF